MVPARGAAKAVVYGLLTAFFVGGALTMLAIGAFRALTVWVPGGVWASYAIVGGILVLGGVLAWSKRNAARGATSTGKAG